MEWKEEKDEYGTWKVCGNVRIPIEPSELYLDFKRSLSNEEVLEPTQEEINLDLDYRLSLVELGIQ